MHELGLPLVDDLSACQSLNPEILSAAWHHFHWGGEHHISIWLVGPNQH